LRQFCFAPLNLDVFAGLDVINDFAEMRLGLRKIDRVASMASY